MKTYTSIAEVCKDALLIQDACNLQAIINTWGAMQSLVREDATKNGIIYQRHPVNVMMLSKIVSLMNVNADCLGGVEDGNKDMFVWAYDHVKQAAK